MTEIGSPSFKFKYHLQACTISGKEAPFNGHRTKEIFNPHRGTGEDIPLFRPGKIYQVTDWMTEKLQTNDELCTLSSFMGWYLHHIKELFLCIMLLSEPYVGYSEKENLRKETLEDQYILVSSRPVLITTLVKKTLIDSLVLLCCFHTLSFLDAGQIENIKRRDI